MCKNNELWVRTKPTPAKKIVWPDDADIIILFRIQAIEVYEILSE